MVPFQLFYVQTPYLISICRAGFVLASSFFGICTLRIPPSYFAEILSFSTKLGKVKERLND